MPNLAVSAGDGPPPRFLPWRVDTEGHDRAHRGLDRELSVQGPNLTGVEYIAFTEPDPDGNSYQPGPERGLFAGVRVVLPWRADRTGGAVRTATPSPVPRGPGEAAR